VQLNNLHNTIQATPTPAILWALNLGQFLGPFWVFGHGRIQAFNAVLVGKHLGRGKEKPTTVKKAIRTPNQSRTVGRFVGPFCSDWRALRVPAFYFLKRCGGSVK